MRIIDVYGNASGQQLNKSKSSVMFGSKVVASLKTDLKRSLEITQEGGMGMYLGLPEKICGSKKQVFSFVQERMNDRTNTWSAKLLSKGGKDVQIKSVAQAVPSYVMSCYLLPQGIKKTYLVQCLTSGGVLNSIIEGCIGLLGIKYVFRLTKEA